MFPTVDLFLIIGQNPIKEKFTMSDTVFTLANGQTRTRYAWQVDAPKAQVLIVHGYAEYAGRYQHVAAALNAAGYDVFAYDQIGHGKLAERLGYYPDIMELAADLETVVSLLKANAPDLPLFLLGHSMGGLVTSLYITHEQPTVAGVVLSSPFLMPDDDVSPMLIRMASVLSRVIPKVATTSLDSAHISRDEAVVNAYNNDPLIPRGGVPTRVGAEMLRGCALVAEKASNFTLPVYVFHGDQDKLANPKGSQRFFDSIAATDRKLKYYRGFYHETMNEPEKDQVISDVVTWLDAHLA